MMGHMHVLTQIFAILAGLVHIGAWLMESVLWRRPAIKKIMTGQGDDSRTLRLFAFNQGFYNLFLALGAILGVVFDNTSVTLFACACMLGAGIVLIVSDRRLWRVGFAQAITPLIALAGALL
jgi:putative membrane protein